MKARIRIYPFFMVLVAMLTVFIVPSMAQEKPADNMQILRDKIKADKKLIIAANMELTESEAKGFWPVCEAYQKDFDAINQRIVKLIKSYAAADMANNLTNDKAQKLTAEFVNIQKAEAELQAYYVPKLSKVLPPKKVARYLQIENKIRAAVKYEFAVKIPLVE